MVGETLAFLKPHLQQLGVPTATQDGGEERTVPWQDDAPWHHLCDQGGAQTEFSKTPNRSLQRLRSDVFEDIGLRPSGPPDPFPP